MKSIINVKNNFFRRLDKINKVKFIFLKEKDFFNLSHQLWWIYLLLFLLFKALLISRQVFQLVKEIPKKLFFIFLLQIGIFPFKID